MSFLSRLFNKPKINSQLLGAWISDLNDEQTKSSIGNVKMTFTEDGKLKYEIKEANSVQIINLVYEVDGSVITTDQPSHPKTEKTEFLFVNRNVLALKYEDGLQTLFNKE